MIDLNLGLVVVGGKITQRTTLQARTPSTEPCRHERTNTGAETINQGRSTLYLHLVLPLFSGGFGSIWCGCSMPLFKHPNPIKLLTHHRRVGVDVGETPSTAALQDLRRSGG